MKAQEATIRYEDAADQITVTGWSCKKCRRFWGDDERMARWCCGHRDQPCDCGARIHGSWTCCEDCRHKLELERFAKRERRDWDGEQMLYSEAADRYFRDMEELLDWIACDREEGDEPRSMADLRIILCEPTTPRDFCMSEFLCDDLGEDGELDDAEINGIVNDWIKAQGVLSWTPGKYALAEGG